MEIDCLPPPPIGEVSSFKLSVSKPSPCLPEGKIKDGEGMSDLLLENSDEEISYIIFPECAWDSSYAELALMDYNKIHHTEYKVVVGDDELRGCNHVFTPNSYSGWDVVHVQFAAKCIEASGGRSPPKLFFAELLFYCGPNDHIVTSCRILDDPKTGCHFCDTAYLISRARSESGLENVKKGNYWVAEDALAYYNLNNNGDYEMVGDPVVHFTMDKVFVAHCNFRAKPKTARDCEESLFFAEYEQGPLAVWEFTACCIIDGCETTAGCYLCKSRLGKKVQHPIGGFRNGLTPV